MLWVLETAAGCNKAISNNNTAHMVTIMKFCTLYTIRWYNLLSVENVTDFHANITLYVPTTKKAKIPDQYILRYSQVYIHSEGQNKSMELVPWLAMRKTRLKNIPTANEKIVELWSPGCKKVNTTTHNLL